MELTPELFEKIEFTERRRGYDTEQVETFLEEAGTALAQLLVRVRHTEERAAAAESRMADADARIAAAEERAQRAEAQARAAAEAGPVQAAPAVDDEAEVQQAGRVLAMAKRTADEVMAEARSQSHQIIGESKTRADRQLAEAQAEAEELIRRARAQADSEFAERRQRAQEDVQALELRRSQLGDIMTQLEARLAGYREDLTRTAEELTLLASDPDRLGARPNMSIPPDEVLGPISEPSEDQDRATPVEEVATDPDPSPAVEATESSSPAPAPQPEVDAGPPTEAVQASEVPTADGDWEPGSWSRVQGESSAAPSAEPEVEISLQDAEASGPTTDRYLRELDEAVNDEAADDDAMTAFFEGGDDSRNRRFGWRR